jgi:cytochrome c-type biogenesis protein CcmH
MSGFLLPAALLVLLAVAFAVSALWQKSRGLAIAIAIALPLAAAGLYAWRGTPAGLDVKPPAPVAATADPAAPAAPADVDKLIADLEARLKADPGQWEGWALLGRVRMEQERFEDARTALAKAHELAPDNDTVAVAYAESMLRASEDRRFPPEAVALLERAAKADPPNETGLFLLGMHRMLSGAPGEAADLWESLLPRLDETAAAALAPQIAAARAAAAQQPQGAPAGPGPKLVVVVSLSKSLEAQMKPGAVLYVFARPESGGPPVAVKRLAPGEWPMHVELTDADRPMPTQALSAHEFVEVTARLSQGGDAIAAPGDIESKPARTPTAGEPLVVLRLDRVRP